MDVSSGLLSRDQRSCVAVLSTLLLLPLAACAGLPQDAHSRAAGGSGGQSTTEQAATTDGVTTSSVANTKHRVRRKGQHESATRKRVASLRRAEVTCERAGSEAELNQWTLLIAHYSDADAVRAQYEVLSRVGFPVYLQEPSETGGKVGLYTGRSVTCWQALEAKRLLDPNYSLDTVVERTR